MNDHDQTAPPDATSDRLLDVVIVGGGQAGLAMGWHLRRLGLRFLVLDAGPALGHVWQARWDSLTLFTPAQYSGLPGMPFPARADTYPTRDPVADYLHAYATAFDLPVKPDARVTELRRVADTFEIRAGDHVYRARQVVVATGPFQVPSIPVAAERLDPSVTQLHSAAYRNPQALPPGPVLVVGGGNSGFQIAEELAATRRVDLSIGARYPVLPQRLLGRDLFWWLTRLGLVRVTATSRLGRRVQARGEFIIGTSRRGLRRAGVRFRPRLTDAQGHTVRFADGSSLDVTTVIWTTGYRSDYSWIHIPGVIDGGRVAHRRGVTHVPGLYFLGLSWQHTRGSALIGFVGPDAAYLADRIAEHHHALEPASVATGQHRST
ncbi:MAG TPA: NAD(P)/FAD-dependent oxidoreductase [Pseudonocardiaceae bacterium]|jgi:putative flavoprotein involved in K+ transport